jgi:hypothetical protein
MTVEGIGGSPVRVCRTATAQRRHIESHGLSQPFETVLQTREQRQRGVVRSKPQAGSRSD